MAKNRIDEITGQGGWPEEPPRPVGPARARMNWKPGTSNDAPVNKNPRFSIPVPEKPEMNYLGQADIDNLIARIKAEEELPPHQKNAARISALKRQALELMKRLESLWVQHSADKLLPQIDEDQAG